MSSQLIEVIFTLNTVVCGCTNLGLFLFWIYLTISYTGFQYCLADASALLLEQRGHLLIVVNIFSCFKKDKIRKITSLHD